MATNRMPCFWKMLLSHKFLDQTLGGLCDSGLCSPCPYYCGGCPKNHKNWPRNYTTEGTTDIQYFQQKIDDLTSITFLYTYVQIKRVIHFIRLIYQLITICTHSFGCKVKNKCIHFSYLYFNTICTYMVSCIF